MLRTRLASAAVLIPLVVGSVLVGGAVYFALVLALALVAGFEYIQMMRAAGHRPLVWLCVAIIVLLFVQAFARINFILETIVAAVMISLIVAIFKSGEGWLVAWALTIAGALYVGGIGMHMIMLRELPGGAQWTGAALLATWALDASAYIFGVNFGRHGFFTHISPKKTWEGAIGGAAAATLAMLLFGFIYDLPMVHSLALGIGISVTGTFGDLAESVIKRQFGVKDSGFLFPGHGGVLDRADSLIFVGVFVYYYLVWILRLQ